MTRPSNMSATFGAAIAGLGSTISVQFSSQSGLHEMMLSTLTPAELVATPEYIARLAAVSPGWSDRAIAYNQNFVAASPKACFAYRRAKSEPAGRVIFGTADLLASDSDAYVPLASTTSNRGLGVEFYTRVCRTTPSRSALMAQVSRVLNIATPTNLQILDMTISQMSDLLGCEVWAGSSDAAVLAYEKSLVGKGLARVAIQSLNGAYINVPSNVTYIFMRAPLGLKALTMGVTGGTQSHFNKTDTFSLPAHQLLFTESWCSATETNGGLTAQQFLDACWDANTFMLTAQLGYFITYTTSGAVIDSTAAPASLAMYKAGNTYDATGSDFAIPAYAPPPSLLNMLQAVGLPNTSPLTKMVADGSGMTAHSGYLVSRPAGFSSVLIDAEFSDSDAVSRVAYFPSAKVSFVMPNDAIAAALQLYYDEAATTKKADAQASLTRLAEYPDGYMLGTWYPTNQSVSSTDIQNTAVYLDYQANRGASDLDFYDIVVGPGTTMKTLRNKVAAANPTQCYMYPANVGLSYTDSKVMEAIKDPIGYSLVVTLLGPGVFSTSLRYDLTEVEVINDIDLTAMLIGAGLTTTYAGTNETDVLAAAATSFPILLSGLQADKDKYTLDPVALFGYGPPDLSKLRSNDERLRAKWMLTATGADNMAGIVKTGMLYLLV